MLSRLLSDGRSSTHVQHPLVAENHRIYEDVGQITWVRVFREANQDLIY